MLDPIQLAARHFRVQPIVCAHTMGLRGLELLHRHGLDLGNPHAMLQVDIQAMKAAAVLAQHYKGQIRIHCNAEMTSMSNLHWMYAMAEHICEGVVVELVERNACLSSERTFNTLRQTVNWMRRLGGAIAMDDWTGTAIERLMCEQLKPEVIKVIDANALQWLSDFRVAPGTNLVVERIESEDEAHEAMVRGATELQGYWCDVALEPVLPSEFTLPGVLARRAMLREARVA